MDESNERRLRTIALILTTALVPVGIVAILFSPETTLTSRASLLIGVVGLSFGIYTHYFEAPEDNPQYTGLDDVIDSESAGVRPNRSVPGFDISKEDIDSAQLTPEEIFHVIKSSPNWHPDGDGSYPTWWRPRLRSVFLSDMFSNKWFEGTLFASTAAGIVLVILFAFSGIATPSSSQMLQVLSSLYPNLSNTADRIVLFISVLTTFSGLSYFMIKTNSTCPACDNPFSLRSQQKHFKPQHRNEVVRIENETENAYEVTYGVHIFDCEHCGSWSVLPKKWERKI